MCGPPIKKPPPRFRGKKIPPRQSNHKPFKHTKHMKTLSQFKQENNITSIDLLQGKGRKYAQVRDIQLVVSNKTDMTKPLFVTSMSEAIDKEQPISESNAQVVPGVYLLINAGVTVTDTI